jgi:uncharacterized membrane-anchored protein YhcB (DUF1043 family)
MEKQDKILVFGLGLIIGAVVANFVFRGAKYTSECEKELANSKFDSEEAKKTAILECIMAKKTKNDAK